MIGVVPVPWVVALATMVGGSTAPTTESIPTAAPVVVALGQPCLDGSHATTDGIVIDCVPWPTHCMDGQLFVIPAVATEPGNCRPPTLIEMVEEVFGAEAPIAERVIGCESQWRVGAVNPHSVHGYHAKGLMQLLGKERLAVRMGFTPDQLLQPLPNLIVGLEVRIQEGWRAWSCY